MGFSAIFLHKGARGQNYDRTKHLISDNAQVKFLDGFLSVIAISWTFYHCTLFLN